MASEIEVHKFKGTDIRTLIDEQGRTWLNVNDVYQVLGLGWPDETDGKMLDAVDAHRIAKRANTDTSEDFIVWLVEGLDAEPLP
jgi:prophage antirepressor-like protein